MHVRYFIFEGSLLKKKISIEVLGGVIEPQLSSALMHFIHSTT